MRGRSRRRPRIVVSGAARFAIPDARLAEVGFLAYVWILGRRAFRAGETGDLDEQLRGDYAPVSG